ncbi:MAG: hypothetical protein KatS3mg101_1071 [Patescibacteria group bacterium]|nr:MAG: hypothetical protein KatS3mg101_1071 [Patescibacteria group bacterium]
MADIVVEIQNLKELQRALRDYQKISEPILQKAVVASQAVFAKYTLKNDPVPYRTGFLLQSFRFATGRLIAKWFPTVHYAIYVHEGTRPHEIYPKNKKALYWEGAEHPVKRVNHPGTKANPFMEKIAKKATPDINKLFIQALDIINREVAKRVNQ